MIGNYFYTLAVAAVAISVLLAIAPGGMKSHLRTLCALCMICLVCMPLSGLLRVLREGEIEIPEDWEQPEVEQESGYEQFSEQMLSGQLTLLLEQNLGISQDDVQVYAEWDGQGGLVRVTLVLSGKAIWQDPAPIRTYVQGLLGCPCVIAIE